MSDKIDFVILCQMEVHMGPVLQGEKIQLVSDWVDSNNAFTMRIFTNWRQDLDANFVLQRKLQDIFFEQKARDQRFVLDLFWPHFWEGIR